MVSWIFSRLEQLERLCTFTPTANSQADKGAVCILTEGMASAMVPRHDDRPNPCR
jgi:hypothetical protein